MESAGCILLFIYYSSRCWLYSDMAVIVSRLTRRRIYEKKGKHPLSRHQQQCSTILNYYSCVTALLIYIPCFRSHSPQVLFWSFHASSLSSAKMCFSFPVYKSITYKLSRIPQSQLSVLYIVIHTYCIGYIKSIVQQQFSACEADREMTHDVLDSSSGPRSASIQSQLPSQRSTTSRC